MKITLFDVAEFVASNRLAEIGDLVHSIFKKEEEAGDLKYTFHRWFFECLNLSVIFGVLGESIVWGQTMKRINFMKMCFDRLESDYAPIHAFDPVTVDMSQQVLYRLQGTYLFNMFDVLMRPVSQLPIHEAVKDNCEKAKKLTIEKHNILMLGLSVTQGLRYHSIENIDEYEEALMIVTFVDDGKILLKQGKNDADTVAKIAAYLNLMIHAFKYHTERISLLDAPEIKLVDYLSYICKYSVDAKNHPLLLTQTKHVLIDCLRESEDDQVIEYALDAIWCLTFFPKNLVLIDCFIHPLLRKLESHEKERIKEKARDLCFSFNDWEKETKHKVVKVEEADVRFNMPEALEYLNDPNVAEERRKAFKPYVEEVRKLCLKCGTTSDLDSALKDLWNAVLNIRGISSVEILVENGIHELLTGRFFREVPDAQKIDHIEKLVSVYGFAVRSNFAELLLKGNFCGQLIELLDRQGRDVTDYENIKRTYEKTIDILNLLILQSKNAEKYLTDLPIEHHLNVTLDKFSGGRSGFEVKVMTVLSACTIGKDRQSLDKIGFKSANLIPSLMRKCNGYIREGLYENGMVALLESLSYLATSEKYAKELILNNVLRPCWHLIQGAPPQPCLIKALEVLWTLAFNQQDAIRKCPAMLFRVSALAKHQNPVIIQLVNSIKTALNGRIEEPTSETHVMISYCWSQKDQVHRLANALKEAGKRVWIDVEKMEGDTFQRMAEGVENAHVVICCTSEEYFNSYACNKEAGYAGSLKKNMIFAKFQHNYKHSGWLGLLQGAELYYDMMDGNGKKFDEHVASIVSKISAFEGQKMQQKKTLITPASQPQ